MAPIDPNHEFNVLVLEDDKDVAGVVADALQTEYAKCQITTASDADEILTEIEKVAEQGKHFYLIITDYTVLKRIKEDVTVEETLLAMLQVSNPRPPVFLIIGTEFKTILQEHPDIEQHVDAYMKKPPEVGPFLDKVAYLLNQYCEGMGGKRAN